MWAMVGCLMVVAAAAGRRLGGGLALFPLPGKFAQLLAGGEERHDGDGKSANSLGGLKCCLVNVDEVCKERLMPVSDRLVGLLVYHLVSHHPMALLLGQAFEFVWAVIV